MLEERNKLTSDTEPFVEAFVCKFQPFSRTQWSRFGIRMRYKFSSWLRTWSIVLVSCVAREPAFHELLYLERISGWRTRA